MRRGKSEEITSANLAKQDSSIQEKEKTLIIRYCKVQISTVEIQQVMGLAKAVCYYYILRRKLANTFPKFSYGYYTQTQQNKPIHRLSLAVTSFSLKMCSSGLTLKTTVLTSERNEG